MAVSYFSSKLLCIPTRVSANKKHRPQHKPIPIIDYRQNVKRHFVRMVALVYLHLRHMMSNAPLELTHFKRVKEFLYYSKNHFSTTLKSGMIM